MLKLFNKFLKKNIDKVELYDSNDEDVKIGSSIVNGEKLEFYMYEEEYYASIKALINGRIIGMATCIINNQELQIADIKFNNNKYRNKGYGSQLMKQVLEYSKKKKINKITGKLSVVDYDHKEILFHFYKKLGFNITLYDKIENNFFGEIEKVLF